MGLGRSGRCDNRGEGYGTPSSRGDGRYAKHTTFVDKLVLPRMILPFGNNSILVNETQSDDVIKWTDTNGDGVADKREVFYSGVGVGRDGNLATCRAACGASDRRSVR